jgi:2'-5' RNA ligase
MTELNEPLRLFFALPLAVEVKAALGELQAVMRRRAERSSLSLRWTDPEQLHVTLKFLGYAPAERVSELAAALERATVGRTPILTCCTQLVAFGSPRRARVLAARLEDADATIAALFNALELELAALGFARDERVFRPHVTLARLKRPVDVRELLRAAEVTPRDVRIDEVVLFRAHLGPEGSRYESVAKSQLMA